MQCEGAGGGGNGLILRLMFTFVYWVKQVRLHKWFSQGLSGFKTHIVVEQPQEGSCKNSTVTMQMIIIIFTTTTTAGISIIIIIIVCTKIDKSSPNALTTVVDHIR